jgi:RNase P subunit RPR2
MHGLYCPNCGDLVLKSDGQQTKVRNRVMLVKGGLVYAVCRSCGDDVGVPLTLDESVVKSLPQVKNPKLFIK